MPNLKPLVLGKLEGEPNDILIEYVADANEIENLRNVQRALMLQSSLQDEELHSLEALVYLDYSSVLAGDKVKWGNETAREATMLIALGADAPYSTAKDAMAILQKELGKAKDDLATLEERQSARRWWIRVYLAQALVHSGAGPEGIGLE